MITFYYGEDSYRSKEAADKMAADFVAAEGGDFGLEKVDGTSVKAGELMNKIMSLPFLGGRKLIIIKNFLSENPDKELKKKVAESLANIPDTSDLIFLETEMPDKRESLFKRLDKEKNKQYFAPLDDLKLRTWISDRVTKNSVKISSRALFKLCLSVGPDLWRMGNEISKLISFVKSNGLETIEETDVELLVEPVNNLKIFDLTDALAEKNSKKALTILHAFLTGGEDANKILNLIIYQFRNTLVVADLASENESVIAREAGLHPFVVKKMKSSLRHFQGEKIAEIYRRLYEIDLSIKLGTAKAEDALDLLVADF